jgi:multidrug transporter EmrE-like cation transporter
MGSRRGKQTKNGKLPPEPNRQCLFRGTVPGIANVLATYCWIRTLAHILGSVAYRTLSPGVIGVPTVAGLVVWKERLRPANWAFPGLASVAVLLINPGSSGRAAGRE